VSANGSRLIPRGGLEARSTDHQPRGSHGSLTGGLALFRVANSAEVACGQDGAGIAGPGAGQRAGTARVIRMPVRLLDRGVYRLQVGRCCGRSWQGGAGLLFVGGSGGADDQQEPSRESSDQMYVARTAGSSLWSTETVPYSESRCSRGCTGGARGEPDY